MPTDMLIVEGTPTVWADITDYAGDGGARTHQIDLTSLASTAARQGEKADLGATRGQIHVAVLRVEFDVAPASLGIVSARWAASNSAASGTANPGGVTGVDAAYTGTAGDSLADSIEQLTLIGSLPATSDADTIIQQKAWMFFPELRYGSPVIYDEADQAFEGDAVEMSFALWPLNNQSQ